MQTMKFPLLLLFHFLFSIITSQLFAQSVHDSVFYSPVTRTSEYENTPFRFGKIELAGGITTITQRSSGANRIYAPDGRYSQNSWSFDLELSMPASRHGKFYSLHEAGINAGIDESLPSFSGFNDDANDDSHFKTTEIWYEFGKNEKLPRFRIGKVDFSSDFDSNSYANCEVEQFISGSFVNNLTLEFPEKYEIGAILWMPFANKFEFGAGAIDKFSIFELVFRSEIAGRKGNYRAYRWFNQFDHQNLTNPLDSAADNDGYGISFDQEVTDRVGIFARYGRQRDEVAEMDMAWSLGCQCSAPFNNRKQDVVGLAYGQAAFGSTGRDIAKLAGIDINDEHHLELYYSFKVKEGFQITPAAQWIRNANGNTANGDAWIFGLRSQISF